MTRLSDYLRAEQPDRTQPASFYGLTHRRKARKPVEEVVDEPLDNQDDLTAEEIEAAAAEAEALKHSEEL